MKRLLIILLSILLASVPVFADYSEGCLYYTIDGNGVVITGYFGDDEQVEIPDHIAGYPVYVIEKGAFAGSTVKKLILPDTMLEVRDSSVQDLIWSEKNELHESSAGPDLTGSPDGEWQGAELSDSGSFNEKKNASDITANESPASDPSAAEEKNDVPAAKESFFRKYLWGFIGIAAGIAAVLVFTKRRKQGDKPKY